MTDPIITTEDDHDRAMKAKLEEEHPSHRGYRLGYLYAAYQAKHLHITDPAVLERMARKQATRQDDAEAYMDGYFDGAAKLA